MKKPMWRCRKGRKPPVAENVCFPKPSVSRAFGVLPVFWKQIGHLGSDEALPEGA